MLYPSNGDIRKFYFSAKFVKSISMTLRRTRRARAGVVEQPPVEEDEPETTEQYTAPILWSDELPGYRIQDLPEERFDEALRFVKKYLVTNSALCRSTRMHKDPQSMEEFLTQCRSHFYDKCSICAICEETDEIVGLAILRVIHQSDYGKVFSRTQLVLGKAYKKIHHVKGFMNRKTDLFQKYTCDKYLRIYELIIHDDYRRKGIGSELMSVSIQVTQFLRVPVLMGIFDSRRAQRKAEKIGLTVVKEIYYKEWVERLEMIFPNTGSRNDKIALMAGLVGERYSTYNTNKSYN